ncbi:MAG: hypothetical protein JSV51_04850 [Candidatus Bathyarchaeota archaeon]|nr:MAG: hypothetical protein JSV51_04850 [Candidatus Bathyarchaeota archaeon]
MINWLLEDDNPPVKYLTMTKILEMEDAETIAIKSEINSYHPIKEILKNQMDNSHWNCGYKLYTGTYWQLKFLSNMHATKCDKIDNAVEFIFSRGLTAKGYFATGAGGHNFDCMTANLLEALIHFGFLGDDRTQRVTNYFETTFSDANGSIKCNTRGLTENCYMVLPQILRALSTIPRKKRSVKIKKGIDLCINRLLENKIYKYVPEKNREFIKATSKIRGQDRVNERVKWLNENPDMKRMAKKSWSKFKFPHSYTSDALDAMISLTQANVQYDPRMKDAIDLVQNQAHNGRWINWSKLRSPMYATIDEYKQESKWLTQRALEVLKKYEGLTIS